MVRKCFLLKIKKITVKSLPLPPVFSVVNSPQETAVNKFFVFIRGFFVWPS